MPQCVKVLPAGSPLFYWGGTNVNSSIPYIVPDPGCAAGLEVLSQSEIAELKQTLKVDTSSDPQRVLDMQAVFYGFLLVLVTVWGLKQLLNLFTGDTDRG